MRHMDRLDRTRASAVEDAHVAGEQVLNAARLPSIVKSDTATPVVPSTRRIAAIGAPEKRLLELAATVRGLIEVRLVPSPSSVSGLVITTCSEYVPTPTKTVSPGSA